MATGQRQAPKRNGARGLRTLSIDVGGTGVKCSVLDASGAMLHEKVRRPTPDPCPPDVLLRQIGEMTTTLPPFDRVSLGFPGAVRRGRVITAPHFPALEWAGYDLAAALEHALDRPARVLNDAEVQGFGVISGKGLELVLTLGTGAGTALFDEGALTPHLELAQHPIRGKMTYNGYVGREALAAVGPKRWNRRVGKTIAILESLIHFDHLYVGGGNSERVTVDLPSSVTLVSNDAGITGGIALWKDPYKPRGRSVSARDGQAAPA